MKSLTEEERRIVANNRPLAYSVARPFRLMFPRFADDLDGEALLGLCEAVVNFKPERGVKLSTFATVLIGRRFWTFLNGEIPQRQNAVPPTYSCPPCFLADKVLSTHAAFAEVDDADERAFIAALLAVASDTDQQVIRGYFLDGVPLKVLGEQAGITKQAMAVRKDKAVGRLRKGACAA